MPDPTPEELRQWREAAVAAGDKEDIAAIDAELAKVKPAGDYNPLEEAIADRRRAVEMGAPQDVLDLIDTSISHAHKQLQQADWRRQVEAMGPFQQGLTAAGAAARNVWEHAKEVGANFLPIGNPGSGFEPEERAARAASREAAEEKLAPLMGTVPGFIGGTTGEAAATAPIALATAPMGPVIGGTLAGAGIGGLMSEPGHRLGGALVGGALGGATGLAGKLVQTPGSVTPTREAQELRNLGMPMTAGQANPGTAVAQVEQAAESTRPFGAAIKARRDRLRLALEQKMLERAEPPGFVSKLEPDAPFSDKLAEQTVAFKQRYNDLFQNAVQKKPLPLGHIEDSTLKAAMEPQGVALTRDKIKAASDLVADQLDMLRNNNNTETLAAARSAIGDQERLYHTSDPALAKHFRNIKRVLTGHVEDALKASEDPEAFAKLKALDTQWMKHKIITEAAALRGDSASDITLTPDKLGHVLASPHRMSPEEFLTSAHGAGPLGDLRVLAHAGKVITSPPRPVTGAMTGVIHGVPYVGPLLTSTQGYFSSHFPGMYIRNAEPGVLRQTLANPVVSGVLGQEARVGALEYAKRLAAQAKAEKDAKDAEESP